MKSRKTVLFILVLVFSGTGFYALADRYSQLQIFSKVLNFVQEYYVEEVNTKRLVYGAIKGMLQELDPHTNFMPPEMYNEFMSETEGEFGGVGIEITLQDNVLTVISPIEDTPAWEAGIQAGDKIVSINGEPAKGLSLSEAAQKMRGKAGTKIKMGVMREGLKTPKVYEIKRAKVKIRSVKYTDLDDGFAYIRITSFIEKTGDDLKKMLKKHKKKHGNIKGVIIDLRNNPGGLLTQAVDISDYFLEKGTIVSTRGRNEKKEEKIYAKKDGTAEDYPLIILINEYSASASEILAGALQDNNRALVVGRRSFGKGSVQSVIKLEDGSALKLTVARYYTPSGESIQARGILPNVKIDAVDFDAYKKALIKRNVKREGDIKGSLKNDNRVRISLWKGRDKDNPSPKDKLLSSDFDVLTAYNYLTAYKMFKTIKPEEDN